MTIIGEAVAAAISANWQVGTGGTKPSIIGYLTGYTERDPNPNADAIFVYLPLPGKFDRVNDTYRNETYDIRIVCETFTSSARQVIIENEVDRIFAIDGVLTGVSLYWVTQKNDISDRQYGVAGPKFKSELSLRVITYMASGATAYGSATVSSLTVDTLTVNTSIAGSPTAALGATTINGDATIQGGIFRNAAGTKTNSQTVYSGGATTDGAYITSYGASHATQPGNIHAIIDAGSGTGKFRIYHFNGVSTWTERAYIDGSGNMQLDGDITFGTAQKALQSILMLGSANAAWVPCEYWGDSANGKIRVDSSTGSIENVDGTPTDLRFNVPLPTTKGTLKLYITGTRLVVYDADAAAYVDNTTLYGYTHTGITSLNADATNYDAQGVHDDTFTAVDCSSYNGCFLWVNVVVDAADELNIHGAFVQAYYA